MMKLLAAVLVVGLALLLVVPGVGWTQTRDPRLSDSQEPGSVLVFPKFVRGTALVDGVPEPRSSFEISIVPPLDQELGGGPHQSVTIRFHWVCPGTGPDNASLTCRETDFTLTTTLEGTLWFNPENIGEQDTGTNPRVPAPKCDRGYLIAYVTNSSGAPIKFDGLIGDAILRDDPKVPRAAIVTNAPYTTYNAIPIQAHPALATGALITLGSDSSLVFDGGAGHYQAVTGQLFGTVRLDNPTVSSFAPHIVESYLTLLTLDVHSNRFNRTVFVDLDFFNAGEDFLSTNTEFVCWTEQQLSTDTGIDPNLTVTDFPTTAARRSHKAHFETECSIERLGAPGDTDPVTCLGILETIERPVVTGSLRGASYLLYNDSEPRPTTFFPNGDVNNGASRTRRR